VLQETLERESRKREQREQSRESRESREREQRKQKKQREDNFGNSCRIVGSGLGMELDCPIHLEVDCFCPIFRKDLKLHDFAVHVPFEFH